MAAKAERAEEVKKIKDGLDVWQDIPRYAKDGYGTIESDDFTRMRWYGIYQQKPDAGHFMLRIKIPGGAMTAFKLRDMGQMAQQYGRNFADITTRQDIQLHWLDIKHMPDIMDRIYNKLGMYQQGSCGDTPRNTTACPLAGEMADEIIDAGPFAQAISDMYKAGGKEFSNLPRKFKTGVSGCASHCIAPQIDCAAIFAAKRMRNGTEECGFGLVVGGGLRDTPHFAQSLRVFIPPDVKLVTDVFRRVCQIFRDQESLRQGRLRARLKFYVAQIGWQAFRDQLEQYLGYPLEHDDSIVAPADAGNDDHVGGGMLKNGLAYVGVPIPRGRLSGDQMVAIADLAEHYCNHPVRQLNATIKQNLLLLNIPPGKLAGLNKELSDLGLPSNAPLIRRQLISCTGTQFCNLAVVETKDRAKTILDYLEANVPMSEEVFVSVTGCPNSCAQYQIADIGLQGVLYIWKGQKGVEHYHVLVGAKLGTDPKFAQFVCKEGERKIKVPADLVHHAISNLIRACQAEKQPGEKFHDWSARQPMPRLAELITIPDDAEPLTLAAG